MFNQQYPTIIDFASKKIQIPKINGRISHWIRKRGIILVFGRYWNSISLYFQMPNSPNGSPGMASLRHWKTAVQTCTRSTFLSGCHSRSNFLKASAAGNAEVDQVVQKCVDIYMNIYIYNYIHNYRYIMYECVYNMYVYIYIHIRNYSTRSSRSISIAILRWSNGEYPRHPDRSAQWLSPSDPLCPACPAVNPKNWMVNWMVKVSWEIPENPRRTCFYGGYPLVN